MVRRGALAGLEGFDSIGELTLTGVPALSSLAGLEASEIGTLVINGMLRVALGFRGTDTHGLKAFRREPVQPIASACQIDRDLFASELVIRAERAGLGVREIPVRVQEKRPPTLGLARRVPNVLKNFAKLFVAIRFKK